MENNTPTLISNGTISSLDIKFVMQEWDRQVEIAIKDGHTSKEAVVIVMAMFTDFFTKEVK
jgi:hypothetical protein